MDRKEFITMIEANELRLGNWVKQDGDIEQVTFKTFELLNDLDTYYVDAIPLTEKILFKCGFTPITNRNTFRIELKEAFEFKYIPSGQKDKCYLVIVKDEGEYCHIVPADSNKDCSFIPLKSLHRLQNLYFALTGKELELAL